MKRFAPVYFLLASTAIAQQSAGPATTKGACSPANTGSNNTFNITCQGISDKLGTQLIDLLNRVSKNQAEAEAVMAKLDGCLFGVNQIVEKEMPRHLTGQQGDAIFRAILPFKGQRLGTFVNRSKRENREYVDELKDVLIRAGWDVYEQGLMISGQEPPGVVI